MYTRMNLGGPVVIISKRERAALWEAHAILEKLRELCPENEDLQSAELRLLEVCETKEFDREDVSPLGSL